MCGICGFNWGDKKLIDNMCSSLKHRGPDQSGTIIEKKFSLGHRRLSILDLSEKGRQPMSDKKNLIISYNGEVYNYKILKKELIEKGYRFKSNTDTEVILYLYKEYKEKCLSKLNGMFAFCIYDKIKNSFFIARDRLGIKPLYYYYHKKRFIFSSELKSIMKFNFKKEINKRSLVDLLNYGFIGEDRTILKNVKKLEAGHYLFLSANKIKIKKYWDLKKSQSKDITKEKIKEEIEKSVKARLISDVPVGAFLSGGVDSSIVVAIASKYIKDLNTFSVAFDIKDFDESKYAKKVSKKFNTCHHELKITSNEIVKNIVNTAKNMDEPLGEPTAIATNLLCKKTSKFIKVCLTGDGGDETFGGYERYRVVKYLDKIRPFKKLIPIKKIRKKIEGSRSDIYENIRTINNEYILVKDEKKIEIYKKYFKFKNILDNIRYSDLKLYTCSDLLKNLDSQSMRYGLEARVPFLDHNLVEKSFMLKNRQLINFGDKKYLLKKIAVEEGVPKECVYRKKKGFSIPYSKYFRTKLKNFVIEELINNNKILLKYLNKKILISVVMDHMDYKKDNSSIIITLIFLKIWLKENGFGKDNEN